MFVICNTYLVFTLLTSWRCWGWWWWATINNSMVNRRLLEIFIIKIKCVIELCKN